MAYSPKEIEEQFKADYEKVCDTFGISKEEAQEIVIIGDDGSYFKIDKTGKRNEIRSHSCESFDINLKRR